MDNCYLCGKFFNESDVIKHDEHIIQQAIGGVLTSNSILCRACGARLGNEIDVPFNMMFDGICTRLDIKKDRGNNKKGTVKGIISIAKDRYGNDLSGVQVFLRDSKVTPAQPMHKYSSDQKSVIVYVDRKQRKNYLKKVEAEITEKFGSDLKPEIIICDDIEGVIVFPLELDNQSFKNGFAKIAIGFASKIGIDRNKLDLVLDVELGNIKDDIIILQFYPKGVLDEIMERSRDKIRYFPSHTLILFTASSNPQLLVCYIELFSTFQWYVILSENYNGRPIYEGYHQRIDKQEDYIFKPGRRYYKERDMILSSLGIEQDRINSTYEKKKGLPNSKTIEEIEHTIIQEEFIKQKYLVDFDDEIKTLVDCSTRQLMSLRSSNTLLDAYVNMNLFYEQNENFNPSGYRRIYVKEGKRYDYIYSICEEYNTENGRNIRKKYGHDKFEMLSKYMQNKLMKDKFKL